jgi:hypothetical protein
MLGVVTVAQRAASRRGDALRRHRSVPPLRGVTVLAEGTQGGWYEGPKPADS